MHLILVALLLGIIPSKETFRVVEFDKIEINHVYSENGTLIFDQLIYWRWHRIDKSFHCHGWKLLKDCRVMDDEAHRKEWEKILHYNDRWSIGDKRPEYKGKFVGGNKIPRWNHRTKRYEVLVKPNSGLWVTVAAPILIERHSLHDPEREDRKFFPETMRIGLALEENGAP